MSSPTTSKYAPTPSPRPSHSPTKRLQSSFLDVPAGSSSSHSRSPTRPGARSELDAEIDELLSEDDVADPHPQVRRGPGQEAEEGENELEQEDQEDQGGDEDGEGEGGWKCEWAGCGRDFRMQRGLVNHLHGGTNREIYVCEWADCRRKGDKQATRHSLITHCRAHTGERPYTCPQPNCSKTFTRSDAMNKHLRSLHGVLTEPNQKPRSGAQAGPSGSGSGGGGGRSGAGKVGQETPSSSCPGPGSPIMPDSSEPPHPDPRTSMRSSLDPSDLLHRQTPTPGLLSRQNSASGSHLPLPAVPLVLSRPKPGPKSGSKRKTAERAPNRKPRGGKKGAGEGAGGGAEDYDAATVSTPLEYGSLPLTNTTTPAAVAGGLPLPASATTGQIVGPDGTTYTRYGSDIDLMSDPDLTDVLPRIRARAGLLLGAEDKRALAYVREKFPRSSRPGRRQAADADAGTETDDSFDEGVSFSALDDSAVEIGRIGEEGVSGDRQVFGRSMWGAKYIMAKAKLMLVEEEMRMREAECSAAVEEELAWAREIEGMGNGHVEQPR